MEFGEIFLFITSILSFFATTSLILAYIIKSEWRNKGYTIIILTCLSD